MTKRSYEIKWYKKEKFGKPITRTSSILIPKATGQTEQDAKNALNLLLRGQKASLKKIEIISMKEFDESGKQIGEDITPSEKSYIVPSAK
jgi:hypothetical protein